MSGYLDERFSVLLDLVAARDSAPGGGAVAAATVSLAGSLVTMAARFSSFPDAEKVAERADYLRGRAAVLIEADVEAYAAVLAERNASAGDGSTSPSARMPRLLVRASEVPLEVSDIGAEAATLAARVVRDGNPNLRGDAATGLLLADAGVRCAALLVRLNVAGLPVQSGGEALVRQAARSVETAQAARASAEPLAAPGGA